MHLAKEGGEGKQRVQTAFPSLTVVLHHPPALSHRPLTAGYSDFELHCAVTARYRVLYSRRITIGHSPFTWANSPVVLLLEMLVLSSPAPFPKIP